MSSIIHSPRNSQRSNLLEDFFQTTKPLIETRLTTLLQAIDIPAKQLAEAARYSLLGESKKFRPLLLLATVQSLGGKFEKALDTACAIEMIHTYSLIHDDLPCMDDDDFRRGRPSLHKAFTEAHAVLAGDFLLTHAFEVIANDPCLSDEQKIRLISLLAKNCGGEGMISGQVLDMEAEGKLLDLMFLQTIHQYKTGALITASVEMGGIIADSSSATMSALKNFGKDIGLAFQIFDDILDVTSSVKKHGRSVSSDVVNEKMTYVKLLGLEKARAKALDLVKSAKSHFPSRSLLHDIADFIAP